MPRAALLDLTVAIRTIEWTRESIGTAIKSKATKHKLKPLVMMAVRTLVTGPQQTPAINAALALLGRERTLSRINRRLGQ